MLSTVRVLPRRVAVITALVLLTMAWVLGAAHLKGASAAEIDGAITGVNIQQSQAGTNTNMRLDLTWAVPDSAQSGDTFTLTLPDELKSVTNGFDLLAPDGSVVAVAHVSGKVVTFTLTDYADTHNDVPAAPSSRPSGTCAPADRGSGQPRLHDATTVFHETVNLHRPGHGRPHQAAQVRSLGRPRRAPPGRTRWPG